MPEQYPFPADRYILIGKVAKAHGLSGEIKIVSLSGQPENIMNYRRLALVAPDGRMTGLLGLARARLQGKQVIAKLETIDTKAEADLIAGMGVLLLQEDLPEPAAGEIYLRRLEGCAVKTLDRPDRIIGRVTHFFNNGAQDVMVVRGQSEEYLIPLVNAIIVSHDSEQVIIDPPDGLLEINAADER